MSLLLCLKNKFDSEGGFTLLELILALMISGVLFSFFAVLTSSLYKTHLLMGRRSARQLDGYLAADFISRQIKNSAQIDLISSDEIHLYTYYEGDLKWLKFGTYYSEQYKELGRAKGGDDSENKSFGRYFSLLRDIKEIHFFQKSDNILRLKIVLNMQSKGNTKSEELIISRLIYLTKS